MIFNITSFILSAAVVVFVCVFCFGVLYMTFSAAKTRWDDEKQDEGKEARK